MKESQNKDKIMAGFVAGSSKEYISQNIAKTVHEKFEFLKKSKTSWVFKVKFDNKFP